MDRPLLTELSFDLQVKICEFLQPPQILVLRHTSKVFCQVTSQRIVWINALNRICRDNFLFLPTHDMSVAELERAAIAPFRWIALSSSAARNDNDRLRLRITRTIKNPIAPVMEANIQRKEINQAYLVPGGRYLVVSGWRFLGVWDLGNVPENEGGRLICMWKAEDELETYIAFIVHPTPDGLGIRILARSGLTFRVFEVYPHQETPKLAKLAEFIIKSRRLSGFIYSLNGNRVVIYERTRGIFIVWDFIANALASWSIALQIRRILDQIVQVTETVIAIHDTRTSLFMFRIPPLKAGNALFDMDQEDPPILSPEFKFVNPNALFQKPDSWYSGDLSSLPLCMDTVFHEEQATRCRLDISRDLSTTRLVPIAIGSQGPPANGSQGLRDFAYRICGGRFVNVFALKFGEAVMDVDVCEVFGSSCNDPGQAHSSGQVRNMRFVFPLTHTTHTTQMYRSFCPASARFVFTVGNDIAIADFLYS